MELRSLAIKYRPIQIFLFGIFFISVDEVSTDFENYFIHIIKRIW